MKLSFSEVTEPLWVQFFGRLEEDFRDGIPPDWRSHPVVNSACEFASLEVLAEEAKYLTGKYEDFDQVISANPPTSIHHLYHLTRWVEVTEPSSDVSTVVEWGGGYGSFARILFLADPDLQYTVIDHPAMLRLHEHFFNSLGMDECNVTRVPVERADEVPQGCDLFVSTWALSESGRAAQNYVADRNWFDAEHLLMAFNAEGGFEDYRNFIGLVADLPKYPAATPESLYVLR